MEHDAVREHILKRIREALAAPAARPFPQDQNGEVYNKTDHEALSDTFSAEFTALQGKLVPCRDKEQLLYRLAELCRERQWKHIRCSIPSLTVGPHGLPFTEEEKPEAIEVAITDCECLAARTGTVIMSSAQASGRVLSVYAPVHIVIASISQMVRDIEEGVEKITKKYGEDLPSAVFFASGPSRTGDIEKTLVMGVHGPVEVHLFLVSDNEWNL